MSDYRKRLLAKSIESLEPDEGATADSELNRIFETIPVDLETFMYSPEYLNHPKLSDIQWKYLAHAEHIYYDETYDLLSTVWENWERPRSVRMMVLQYGKGSGKDLLCRLTVVRCAYLLMCLRNPQEYFGIPSNDSIHMLNVAVSADQAKRAFFNPLKELFVSNPILNKFFRGDPPSEMATSIRLKKRVEIVSGHSMAESQEGLNILVGVADEISAFKTEQELKASVSGRSAKTAEQIVKMLRTSARTRFPKSFKVIQISYPRFAGDAIQSATKTGLDNIDKHGEKSQWYVSGPHATWDVNPRVTREDFQSDYDEDPEMSAAMYECKPPKAIDRFIRDDISIAECFLYDRPEPIEVHYYWGFPKSVDDSSRATKEGWQVEFSFHPSFMPIPGARYALHGDLAIVGDRAGIAMSHVKRVSLINQPNGEIEERPYIYNDFTFAFEANLAATAPGEDGKEEVTPREVQLRWYRQLVWELIDRGFDIASVTFDGFQSVDMIQTLEMYGIDSGKLSLDVNDAVYQNFKDVILDRRLESYANNDLILEEIRSLRRLPNKKIDHPPGKSKDLADSLAGSVMGAQLVGGSEEDSGGLPETDLGIRNISGRPQMDNRMELLLGTSLGIPNENPFSRPALRF